MVPFCYRWQIFVSFCFGRAYALIGKYNWWEKNPRKWVVSMAIKFKNCYIRSNLFSHFFYIFWNFCPRGHLVDHLPTYVDNRRHLINHHLPHFVHVVIECPLIRIDKIWAQVLQLCWQIELAFLMQGVIKKTLNYKIIKHCPNVSITPLRQWGFWQCLPFSWAILKDKHCWHPIAIIGVV